MLGPSLEHVRWVLDRSDGQDEGPTAHATHRSGRCMMRTHGCDRPPALPRSVTASGFVAHMRFGVCTSRMDSHPRPSRFHRWGFPPSDGDVGGSYLSTDVALEDSGVGTPYGHW